MLSQRFKTHLTLYLLVNVLLIGIWAASGAGYFWPIWPILGWGIGLAAHAAPLLARGGSRPARPTRAPGGSAHGPSTSVDEVVAAVGSEQPSLRRASAPDGTVTVLFTDIEASTALNERVGDVRWLELLRAHNAVVREQVHTHGGFEVKSQGDGFMIAFASARRALGCAAAIQRAFAARNGTGPDQPLRVRIGLHTGEAIREGDDFFGRHVNLAARVAAKADGGEVLVSALLKDLAEGAADFRFDGGRETELKGLAGRHRVFALDWEPQATAA